MSDFARCPAQIIDQPPAQANTPGNPGAQYQPENRCVTDASALQRLGQGKAVAVFFKHQLMAGRRDQVGGQPVPGGRQIGGGNPATCGVNNAWNADPNGQMIGASSRLDPVHLLT